MILMNTTFVKNVFQSLIINKIYFFTPVHVADSNTEYLKMRSQVNLLWQVHMDKLSGFLGLL